MRHTPCGCRSAHLVEVRSNSRLPPVSAMRRAKQCRYFARSPPPSKRHSRLTIVRRGCKTVTIRRDSWRSHVHRTYTAQRVQLFEPQTANVRGRGDLPSRSLGGLRGPFSHVREWPPYPRPLHGAGKNAPCEYAGNNTTQCVKTMLTGSFQAIPQTRPARAAGRYASATACCSRGKTPPPM